MKRGDVLLCRFPHASATPSRIRPALMVQSDDYNRKIANLLVAAITSNLVNAAAPAHYLIDVSTPEGQRSGLDRKKIERLTNDERQEVVRDMSRAASLKELGL